MANEQNLRPLNTRSQRERQEIARMGAKSSNQAKANKKLLRQAAKLLIEMPVDNDTKSILENYNLPDKDRTYATAIVVAQLKRALNGDTKAFIALRDIVGEQPRPNKQDESGSDNNIVVTIVSADEGDIEKRLTE